MRFDLKECVLMINGREISEFADGADYDIIDNIDGKSFVVIDDFGELCIVNGNTENGKL